MSAYPIAAACERHISEFMIEKQTFSRTVNVHHVHMPTADDQIDSVLCDLYVMTRT